MNMSAGARYYNPIEPQYSGEVTYFMKRVRERERECERTSNSSKMAFVLTRRYPLTASGFKHLEICIAVGPPAVVQLELGDNRGNKILLPYDVYKKILQKRAELENMFCELHSTSEIKFSELMIGTCIRYGTKMYKLSMGETTIIMTPLTFHHMLELNECVALWYEELHGIAREVNTKFDNFVKIVRDKRQLQINQFIYEEQAIDAIRENADYDCNDIIDCELLALASADILRAANTPRDE